MHSTPGFSLAVFLCAIFLLLRLALAADCYGDKGQHPLETYAWEVRQSMCGDNGCALSDAERGDNTECVIYTQIKNRTIARVYRSTTTGNYEHCWDALGNAIEQCFRDISESYTGAEGITQGTWSLDGEYYWVQIWTSDEFAIYEPEGQGVIGIDLDEVDNDPDTPGRDYVWGPQFYCMTPSTGGVTCFPIEKGCFILSPVDDTIPDIICG